MANVQMGNEINGHAERVYLHASEYKTYPPLSQDNIRISSDYGNIVLKSIGALPSVIHVHGWEKRSGKWKYMQMNGFYVSNDWILCNGQWYYFDENEFMVLGWRPIKGVWYYFQEELGDGSMMTNRWQEYKGLWYYLSAEGPMAVSTSILSDKNPDIRHLVNERGEWYKDEEIISGWRKQADGRWKYKDENGAFIKGWKKDNGEWYYFDDNEYMVIGWLDENGKRYYLHGSGAMAYSAWQQIEGLWYYFKLAGDMATDTWIPSSSSDKKYYVDENGVWDENKQVETEWIDRLVNVALLEVGTAEGVDEKGNGNNMVKYGEWYGSNGQPWCAMFISWCANQIGVLNTKIPSFARCEYGKDHYIAKGSYHLLNSGYEPKKGDIFFHFKNGRGTGNGHVGIVIAYDVQTKNVYAVEGNTDDAVRIRERPWTDYFHGFASSGGSSYGKIPAQFVTGEGKDR